MWACVVLQENQHKRKSSIDNASNKDPQKLQNPQWIFHGKLNLFLFMIVVYDSVGDGDKISKKNLHRFHVTSHLKTEAKVFFS